MGSSGEQRARIIRLPRHPCTLPTIDFGMVSHSEAELLENRVVGKFTRRIGPLMHHRRVTHRTRIEREVGFLSVTIAIVL
jgi:hypothetical protein